MLTPDPSFISQHCPVGPHFICSASVLSVPPWAFAQAFPPLFLPSPLWLIHPLTLEFLEPVVLLHSIYFSYKFTFYLFVIKSISESSRALLVYLFIHSFIHSTSSTMLGTSDTSRDQNTDTLTVLKAGEGINKFTVNKCETAIVIRTMNVSYMVL